MTDSPNTIWVHHIGGGPDTDLTKEVEGPLTGIPECRWVFYDANEEATTASKTQGHLVVPKAIWREDSDATFYETAVGSASSLLRSDPDAKDYTVKVGTHRLQVWGSHTRVKKEVAMKVYSLDRLVERGEVPPVDFLSIDAQGAELGILDGAEKQVRENVVGIILEAEFTELYANQPLFCDTMDFLVAEGFRLCDIVNIQHFNTYPYSPEILGDGFMSVCEAIYLKDYDRWADEDRAKLGVTALRTKMLKTAAISAAFGRLDYAIRLCERLELYGFSLVEAAVNGPKYVRFLRDLLMAARVVNEESPPVLELNGGLGQQAPLPPPCTTGMPDPVSRVLLNYGFHDVARKHMERVADYREARRVRA